MPDPRNFLPNNKKGLPTFPLSLVPPANGGTMGRSPMPQSGGMSLRPLQGGTASPSPVAQDADPFVRQLKQRLSEIMNGMGGSQQGGIGLQTPPQSLTLAPQRQQRDMAEQQAMNAQPAQNEGEIAQLKAKANLLKAQADLLAANPAPQMEQTEYPGMPQRQTQELPQRQSPQYDPLSMGLATLFGAIDPQQAGNYVAQPLQSAVQAADQQYADRQQQYVETAKRLQQEYEDELLARNDGIRQSRERADINFGNAKAKRAAMLDAGELAAQSQSQAGLVDILTGIDAREQNASVLGLKAKQADRGISESIGDSSRDLQRDLKLSQSENGLYRMAAPLANLVGRLETNSTNRANTIDRTTAQKEVAGTRSNAQVTAAQARANATTSAASTRANATTSAASTRANASKYVADKNTSVKASPELAIARKNFEMAVDGRKSANTRYEIAKNSKGINSPEAIEAKRTWDNANNDVAMRQKELNAALNKSNSSVQTAPKNLKALSNDELMQLLVK